MLLAGLADAHAPARIRVASPSEGGRVVGDTVRIVLVGEGGDSAATFRLDLDGRPVDATGTIGGVFTTLSVRPNEQVVLDVPVGPGDHTLVVTPTFDPDAQQETTVRRFTAVEETGGGAIGLVLAGLAVAGAVGAAVLVRRRAAASAGDVAPPGDRPASGPAAP